MGGVRKGRGTVLHMKLVNAQRRLVDRPSWLRTLGVGEEQQGKGEPSVPELALGSCYSRPERLEVDRNVREWCPPRAHQTQILGI